MTNVTIEKNGSSIKKIVCDGHTGYGVEGEDNGSLKDFGIKYTQIELKNDAIDEELAIKKVLELKPKMVYMQRSRGYGWRKPLSIEDFDRIIKKLEK